MVVSYEPSAKYIAKKIKELRIAKGLTVQELAYRCDMERSNISRLEAGRSNPTLRTLCTVSQALEIPLGELCR